MGAGDDSSFFLYGVGERPEALTLGSLVLEKYWQPMNARHYAHDLLSDDALEEHAYTTNLNNVIFHGYSRVTPSVSVDGGDIVNLGLAYNKDLERIVVAEKGMRMILKDPEMFLTNSVLKSPLAQQKLKLWLSAAYSAYVINFKFARRPKVWLLTGLYLLEGARTIVSKGQSAEVSAGISSGLVGALSGVPVGGTVSLGVGSSWEMAMEVADPHVWAAQFRLLDARFIKVGKKGIDEVKLPASMGLYRDVMSVNTARGGEGNSVELGLEEEQEHSKDCVANDQESQGLEEYEKRLEQAIKMFEKAPKHFLQ
ncbi:hypothetical protein N7462_003782 [Penicillium macrosclerotiorum]|uniref:uncharacterized protein n=1 Tax=Penicillium macrosclerotiorum TaxID=303699 RepID=UPI002546AF78|nr:uncharacterized protein N7462_003782 [Penicillium macrosclerotiorum]KAJ5689390.1 hypothetical protein N7462_003782 [Penicillium macrosclerotiorum]